MNAIDLSKLSPRERKAFSDGLAIVKRKLEAARQNKATREAREAVNRAKLITSRVGGDVASKCFGVPPSKPTTAKPSPARKSYSAGTDEKPWPRATRFLSISAGTAGPRPVRKIYSGPIFGR